jgi:hypothetical protein
LDTLILKKLKKVKIAEQYGLKMSKRITGLENLDGSGYINRVWENIRENIKISYIRGRVYRPVRTGGV